VGDPSSSDLLAGDAREQLGDRVNDGLEDLLRVLLDQTWARVDHRDRAPALRHRPQLRIEQRRLDHGRALVDPEEQRRAHVAPSGEAPAPW
jgi:hypothetical protein